MKISKVIHISFSSKMRNGSQFYAVSSEQRLKTQTKHTKQLKSKAQRLLDRLSAVFRSETIANYLKTVEHSRNKTYIQNIGAFVCVNFDKLIQSPVPGVWTVAHRFHDCSDLRLGERPLILFCF